MALIIKLEYGIRTKYKILNEAWRNVLFWCSLVDKFTSGEGTFFTFPVNLYFCYN